MKKILLIFFIAGWTSSSRTGWAGFSEVGAGARATGMAEAFTAVSDDATALHYNPAGLTELKHSELITQVGQFFNGLTDGSTIKSSYLAYAQPLHKGKWGAAGVSYQQFQGADFFTDRQITASYGWRLKNRMGAGVAVKQFHRRYEPTSYNGNAVNDAGNATGRRDPLFSNHGTSIDSFSLDAGAMIKFGPRKKNRFGFAFTNVAAQDDSLAGINEKPVRAVKAGLASHLSWGIVSLEARRVKRLLSGADMEAAIGAERTFGMGNLGTFALRGGYEQGSRNYKSIAAGFSLGVSKARLDYSFNMGTGDFSDAKGGHRVALSLGFGKTTAAEPTVELRKNVPGESFAAHRLRYLIRKAEGASVSEKLKLLQELYRKFGAGGADLTWLSAELSSL